MNSVNLNIKSKVVECETRPLRSSWTKEMVSDIEVFSAIDVNKELERILIAEIRKQTRKDRINKIFSKHGSE